MSMEISKKETIKKQTKTLKFKSFCWNKHWGKNLIFIIFFLLLWVVTIYVFIHKYNFNIIIFSYVVLIRLLAYGSRILLHQEIAYKKPYFFKKNSMCHYQIENRFDNILSLNMTCHNIFWINSKKKCQKPFS